MASHSATVSADIRDAIGIVTIDNPPVNAIAPSVREGLQAALQALQADTRVRAIVLLGAGDTFVAGADIRFLGAPPPRLTTAALCMELEDCRVPLIAALHGNTLGGGLELALACHYRCALPGTNLGLPEVNLGIIPGGGGTQRLPRVVGVAKALQMIIGGAPIKAAEAAEIGLLDRVLPAGDLFDGALAYARELLAAGAAVRRVRERLPPAADDAACAAAERDAAKTRRGERAPLKAIEAVRAAAGEFAAGLQVEKDIFDVCRQSPQARALRHMFAAERQVGKVPGIDKGTPVREIRRVGVVGAGTMGRGIAMALANAGLDVLLIEAEAQALDKALGLIRETYETAQAKGRMSGAEALAHVARIQGSLELRSLAPVDLIVEAVFEDLAIKRELFGKLDSIARPDAVLATNTSALDIDAIADATQRPGDVIGLHFFSPANIMRLLEIVRGRGTSPEVIATALALARRLRKTGVLAGNCDGFIGNRMLAHYRREADYLLLEGASVPQVDGALYRFGFAMGPHAVSDLAGHDIGAASRKRRRAEGRAPSDPRFGLIGDTLVAMGRLGQKTGMGMYRYESGSRAPIPDPEVEQIIERAAAKLGIARRAIGDEEIVERCMLALANEGARILEEGMALRAGDIDVVYVSGYGFPRYRGGPMGYADELGLALVIERMQALAARHGADDWTPAPLLARLAAAGKRFADQE